MFSVVSVHYTTDGKHSPPEKNEFSGGMLFLAESMLPNYSNLMLVYSTILLVYPK